MKNRSRVEIAIEILRTALEPSKKTVIMYKCSLEYPQLKEYLPFLQENQLLEFIRETKLYKTTPKGVHTMELFEHMERVSGLYVLPARHHQQQQQLSKSSNVLLQGR
jgi:predicted transcriptional regulator